MYAIRPVFKEHAKHGCTLPTVFDTVGTAAMLAELRVPFVVEDQSTGKITGGRRWLAAWATAPRAGDRRVANVNGRA